jgi:group I intron endonuclease
MIIYKCTNTINGKFYIGKTEKHLNVRIAVHKSNSNKAKFYFHRSLNKHGFDKFKWEIIATASSKEELSFLEKKFIEELKPQYNMTKGGEGSLGLKMSDVAKSKISKFQKGKIVSSETAKKISLANRGKKRKPLSEEHKKKLSIIRKGIKKKPLSEETKEKMSLSTKGRIPWNKGVKYKDLIRILI